MSRILRSQGAWPASQYARFLWLAFGLWEDIYELSGIYKSTSDKDQALVIARHLLVDFDSLDELLKEFHDHIKHNELKILSPEHQQILSDAFSNYHRALEPRREEIKEIRNNLGSHRTGLPWQKASRRNDFSPQDWGKWEGYLTNLEQQCDLHSWLDTINSARSLLETLEAFNLSAWFNIPEDGNIRFSMPILPPGYYPPRKSKH